MSLYRKKTAQIFNKEKKNTDIIFNVDYTEMTRICTSICTGNKNEA